MKAIDLLKTDVQFAEAFDMTIDEMADKGADLEIVIRKYLYKEFPNHTRAALVLTGLILETLCREQAISGQESEVFDSIVKFVKILRQAREAREAKESKD